MPRRYLNLIAAMIAGTVCAVLPVYSAANESAQLSAGALGKAPNSLPKSRAIRAAGSETDAVNSTPVRDVLTRNWVIGVNQYSAFEWPTDLSGADKVHVSLTSVGDTNSRLSNVHIVVAFAGPGDWYVVSDVIQGNTFPYFDHISFTTPVYGPLMKLIIFNDGGIPVQITQLAAYAVAR